MKVQAPGRLPMQPVFLWKGNTDGRKNEKGLTTRPHDIKKDDTTMNPVEQLPSAQELPPGPDVVQYLEVGIVIGDDPSRFKPAPLTDKKNKDDRKKRGDIPRHTSAIRAFIRISPTIASQAKYVVGVQPMDGYLQPHVIDSECIFFYSEIWKGIEKAPKKVRKALMSLRVKRILMDAHMQAEDANATIMVNGTTSPDPIHGVKGFFDFDEELSLEDAASVAHELKIAAPINVDVVQATHRIMREHKLGHRLPCDELAFLLALCSYNIPSIDVGEVEMVEEVKRALDAVEFHSNLTTE